MKSCEKSVSALLLLVHLLALCAGDAVAGCNDTRVANDKQNAGSFKITQEEMIVGGDEKNVRATAETLAENPTRTDDKILSKREIRRERSKRTSSNQNANRSASANFNATDENDLEKLKHAIAEYEPQKIGSRKAKRKIVDAPSKTHDARELSDKTSNPMTDFERIYQEVLQNISRKMPQLVVNNADLTLNPHLSEAIKTLKRSYVPETTIHMVTNGGRDDKSRVEFPHVTSALKKKRLPTNYSPSNRTLASSRIPANESTKFNEEIVDGDETTEEYFRVPKTAKTKPNENELSTKKLSSSANYQLDARKKVENRSDANVPDFPTRVVPSFPLLSNASDRSYDADSSGEKQSNPPINSDILQLQVKRIRVPRPFVAPFSSEAADTVSFPATNIKPRQIPRSYRENILPLVLPADLLNSSPVRRYVPIKRAHRLPKGNSATTIVTGANPSAYSAGIVLGQPPIADYIASYANVISTTRAPTTTTTTTTTISGESHRRSGSSDYRAVTEKNPVAKTNENSALSFLYPSQRPGNLQVVRERQFLPGIVNYDDNSDESPGGRTSQDLNANAGFALYNKFANLYSTGVPSAPKPLGFQDYQDFKQPASFSHVAISRPISPRPYATSLTSVSPVSLKVQPIVEPLAPYYNALRNGLISPRNVTGKELDDDEDEDEHEDGEKTNEKSRVEDANATEEEEDDKDDGDDDDDDTSDLENYKIPIAYKIYETPRERKKEVREEDQRCDRKHRECRDKSGNGKYEGDLRHEDDEDEDDDESKEEEYASAERIEDERNRDRPHHRYNKDERNRRDRLDRLDRTDRTGVASNSENLDVPRYETRTQDKGHRDRYDRKKSAGDGRYRKNREREEYEKDEDDVAEDKPIAQRSKDARRVRGQREKYKESQNNDTTRERKQRHRYRTNPPKGSREREEYSETNPEHVRREFRRNDRRRVKVNYGDRRRHDSADRDDDDGGGDKAAKVRDHEHGETREHESTHAEHHEAKKNGGDHKYEKGEGTKHDAEHHEHKGEKGDEGYKVWDEHEKAEKGHHDKEHSNKEYDEKGGEEKKHEEESGHHEEHHNDEEGGKTAEFGEKGKHQKGHNTKGEHSIHKKDEYEKKTEFFDEFHEDGGEEKHDEHHHEHESKKGGHGKKGHRDNADHEEKYGKKEKYEKGGHHRDHKGHKVAQGHDNHYDHDQKYGKKEGYENGKKWTYENNGDGGKKASGDKH